MNPDPLRPSGDWTGPASNQPTGPGYGPAPVQPGQSNPVDASTMPQQMPTSEPVMQRSQPGTVYGQSALATSLLSSPRHPPADQHLPSWFRQGQGPNPNTGANTTYGSVGMQNKSYGRPGLDVRPAPSYQPQSGQPPAGYGYGAPEGQHYSGQLSPMTGQYLGGYPTQRSRKKKLLVGLAAFLVIGGILAGVFGWYVPNRPDNVWKTGIGRTGEAMAALLDEATSKENLKDLTDTRLTGNLNMTASNFGSVKGSIDSWKTEKASDTTATATYTGTDAKERNLGFQLKTQLANEAQYPDGYLTFTGLTTLGADMYLGDTTQYEGKWFFASGKYLESLAGQSTGGESEAKDKKVTDEEYIAATKDVMKTTQEYVFSSDSEKAVLENRRFVGKEMIQGIKTNQYTVGINKANAKKYCEALAETVINTAAYKKTVSDAKTRKERLKEQKAACKDKTADIQKSDTFDVWIGGTYRIVHKMRFADSKNKKDYVDIGHDYQGGDKINMYAVLKAPSKKTDMDMRFVVNKKISGATAKITVVGRNPESAYDIKVNLTTKPYKGKQTIDTPTENIINVQELLQQMEAEAGTIKQDGPIDEQDFAPA